MVSIFQRTTIIDCWNVQDNKHPMCFYPGNQSGDRWLVGNSIRPRPGMVVSLSPPVLFEDMECGSDVWLDKNLGHLLYKYSVHLPSW